MSFPASDEVSSSRLDSSIIFPGRPLPLDAAPVFIVMSPDVPDPAAAPVDSSTFPDVVELDPVRKATRPEPASASLLDTSTAPLAPAEDAPPLNARLPPSSCPEPAERDILPPFEDTLFPAPIITFPALPSPPSDDTLPAPRSMSPPTAPPLPACTDTCPPAMSFPDPFPD